MLTTPDINQLLGQPPSRDRGVAARWTPKLAKAGFTPIASVFLENYARLGPHPGAAGLNASEAMLVVQLMTFKWDERAPYPTTSKLAKRMGVSPRYVRELAKRLEDLKLLRRYRPTQSSANRWDLTPLFERLEKILETQVGEVHVRADVHVAPAEAA